MYTIVFIDFFFLVVIYGLWKIFAVTNAMLLLIRLVIRVPVVEINFIL